MRVFLLAAVAGPLALAAEDEVCSCHHTFDKRELGHGIYQIDQFLSVEEVAAVLSLTSSPKSRQTNALMLNEALAWDDTDRYASMPLNSSKAILLDTIERRIGCLTGIAPHDQEDPMMVAVNRKWDGRHTNSEDANNTLMNLHHDRNGDPKNTRVATVLIYLSSDGQVSVDHHKEGGGDTVSPEHSLPLEGGATLFPCVRPVSHVSNTQTTAMSELCGRLVRGYEAGHKWLVPTHRQRKGQFVDADAAQAASALCPKGESRDVHDGILRVLPKLGAALLFWSASPDDVSHAHRHMWHGGCRVWQGEKWTLQKFKGARLPHTPSPVRRGIIPA